MPSLRQTRPTRCGSAPSTWRCSGRPPTRQGWPSSPSTRRRRWPWCRPITCSLPSTRSAAADLDGEPILIPLDDVVALGSRTWNPVPIIGPRMPRKQQNSSPRGSACSSFRNRLRGYITARTSPTARSPTHPHALWRLPSQKDRSRIWSRSSSESCGVANPVRREGEPSKRRSAPHGRRLSRSRPHARLRVRSPASRVGPSGVNADVMGPVLTTRNLRLRR